jgi:hypothetical protein
MTRTEELLDEIADYADQLAESQALADADSMTKAAAIAELYEKREWVDEWLEQKPIPRRKAHVGGRPADPEGRNRFTQWLVWKEQQRRRRALRSTQTYDLLNAYEIDRVISGAGNNLSVRARRPLNWLRKYKYIDRADEVWKRAVELAGSADLVTSAHTAQALAEWKKDTLGTKGVRVAIRTAKAERDRAKAQAYIRTLWDDGDDEQVKKFDAWYRDFRKGAAT